MNHRKLHARMRSASRRGFTLIEMMIVAALISIMSAMATVSIMTMMEQAKQRTSLAECRQVATAAGFVNTDLGFYPKLCFLRMGYNELMAAITGTQQIPVAQFEYHGHVVSNIQTKLTQSWSKKGAYMSSSVSRDVKMVLPGANGEPYYWPGDPWGNPYVLYLMKSTYDTNTKKLTPRFIEKATEKPDYFAAVVSYGRNTVPGGLESNSSLENNAAAMATRLYTIPTNAQLKTFQALQPGEYNTVVRINPACLNIDSTGSPVTPSAKEPRMREPGSDDLIVEF